jgi:hypothetical protein
MKIHKLEAKDAMVLSKIETEKLLTEWCKKYNVFCTIFCYHVSRRKPSGNLEP